MPFFIVSSLAWFLKFTSQLKGTARLRPLRCNGSGAIIKTVTSDSPGLALPLISFLFSFCFPFPSCLPCTSTSISLTRSPLIIAGWLSIFQQSFFGFLINCLLSVCGVGLSVVHTCTSSAGLFSAALWSPFCKSSDKIVELTWQMESRGVMFSVEAQLWQTFRLLKCLPI